MKVESQILKKSSFKTTHNGGFYKSSLKDKNKFSNKTSPSNFSREHTPQHIISKDISYTPNTLFAFRCDKRGGRGEREEFLFGSGYLRVWVRMREWGG